MYFYDLPKTTTSTTLADAIKKTSGHSIDPAKKPQINRNPNKDFYSGAVQIKVDSIEELEEIKKKLRYFDIDG